ncbi:MAG: sigma-70 family RNA polymerase sigma factor [Cytophagaceae bacterium]|nr:sigma-70 family RNA polymerase sigma factor [Cytophagaceae bacterium]MDW8456879.1 sigma-70 family RNA polymerase sigma factor [Cytophagaceae bacterium]
MMYSKLSDTDLVSLYMNGNEEAFAALVKRCQSKVFTTIYLIVKDRGHAEDLLQETFFKVIRKLKSGDYNNEGKFIQWVCRIARNLAIDSFRRNKRYPMTDVDEVPKLQNSLDFSEESIEALRIKNETHTLLQKLIEKLPENQREVLIMRHYAEMSFQEIAEETGVSINTALGRMRYALINLRKLLKTHTLAYDKNYYPST